MNLELINIQYTNNKTPTKNNTSVFILTKNGIAYNSEGIDYIRKSLAKEFNVKNDLSIYTGIGINEPTVLAKFIQTVNNPYIVLSHKDGIGFFPSNANSEICDNLIEGHTKWPNMTSWQIIMKTSGLTLY